MLVEYCIERDDSSAPAGTDKPKYATIAKGMCPDGTPFISIEEADPGFHTNDAYLQQAIDNYFHRKNLQEFKELNEARRYEQIATNDYGRKLRYIDPPYWRKTRLGRFEF